MRRVVELNALSLGHFCPLAGSFWGADSIAGDPEMLTFRPYLDDDADSWLRCRVLSFLYTDYYDDVLPKRPTYLREAICLVAHDGDRVVGLIDTEIADTSATIGGVAVHPDAARRGIGSALLAQTIETLRDREVHTLDAWTREDTVANAWYRASGFVENFRYVQVLKESQDSDSGFESPPRLSRPVRAFAHAPLDMETELRARYQRVYVCRQYVRLLDGS